MKTLPMLVSTLAVLVTLGGLGIANAATTVKGSKSNSDAREAAPAKSVTGKVTQVDAKTKTFVLTAKGNDYKFTWPKGGGQPKVGAVLDVTYTGTLGGPGACDAINLNTSRSNAF